MAMAQYNSGSSTKQGDSSSSGQKHKSKNGFGTEHDDNLEEHSHPKRSKTNNIVNGNGVHSPTENSNRKNGHSHKAGKSNGESSMAQKAAAAILNPDGESYTPIKSLNTFLFDWKIKARVTKKHNKKTWKNNRGQGTLLNVELIDNQGTQI